MRRPWALADEYLQVGVVARQPAGDRHGLRIVRVYAAGARQRQLRELVGVGALELDQAAVLEQLDVPAFALIAVANLAAMACVTGLDTRARPRGPA